MESITRIDPDESEMAMLKGTERTRLSLEVRASGRVRALTWRLPPAAYPLRVARELTRLPFAFPPTRGS
jgi:hypothetical protein